MTRWFLMLGLAGCSLTLSGPDPNRPQGLPTCDSSKTLVAFDGTLAGAAGIIALSTASSSGGAALAAATAGALLIGSAIHGNSLVDRCRAANDAYVASARREPRAPLVADEPPPPDADVQPDVQPAPAPPQSPPPPQPKPPWAEFWKEVR